MSRVPRGTTCSVGIIPAEGFNFCYDKGERRCQNSSVLHFEILQRGPFVGMASLAGIPGGKTLGMYEPIHGSAPSRAGQNLANPIATILSVAMMLRYSFELETEAHIIENAVLDTLEHGYRTYDIMSEGKIRVGTKEMGELIAQKVKG